MKKKLTLKLLNTVIILIFISSQIYCGNKNFVKKKEYNCPEARQGIAVDANFFYVVDTRKIGKYNKETGMCVAKWEGNEDGPIRHLDSGVIINGKLFCAHSNYPDLPMASSIEIWNAETLEHLESHSFGIYRGSCTWVDYSNGNWYAAFAHYKKWEYLTGKNANWTTIVKFDENWIELESWVFPKVITDKFGNMSNSGGSFGPDNLLYCTGHDAPELYVLKFPKMGSVLELVDILPIVNTGQGIAWDRSKPNFIYCIKKKDRQVIVSEFLYNQ